MDKQNQFNTRMDKEAVIKICMHYLDRLKKNKINFSEAYLFGSAIKGTMHPYSDIDIAIVLSDDSNNFEKEVLLMVLRSSKETIIEPHSFNHSEFTPENPLVNQILKSGLRLV